MTTEAKGFTREIFESLANLESRNFWFRSRNKLIAWAMARYFPHAKDVLEIGCGTGFVLSDLEALFPAMRLAGSDVQISGLARAARRIKSAALFQMDARRIPFEDEFDVIGAFDVLEHIKEDEQVLVQMHRAVKSGGGIMLTVPQHMFLWSEQDVQAHHVLRYDADALVAKVRRAGFEVERSTSFVSLLLPLMMLSRRAKWFSRRKPDPTDELRVFGPLNFLLERVLDVERAWILLGGRFPLGGSLLIVARKH
jgi:SAM-dependent methyltransferase